MTTGDDGARDAEAANQGEAPSDATHEAAGTEGHEGTAQADPTAESANEATAEPRWRERRWVPEPHWVALDRLDSQWEDSTPLAERERTHALLLTTDEDPRGWDYLGAMTGATNEEVADACSAWLTAQLAADAVRLGRSYRPRVALVPAGRQWHVVRTVAHHIILIDGPGWPTPYAAARAASRRYHAELLRELERAGEDVPSILDSDLGFEADEDDDMSSEDELDG